MDSSEKPKRDGVKPVGELMNDEFMSRFEKRQERRENSSYVNLWDVTWEKICEIEPRLIQLKAQVDKVAQNSIAPFCANGWWYKIFKPQMIKLVGINAEKDSP